MRRDEIAGDTSASWAGPSPLAAQRAEAFDRLSPLEALAKHPELDGAYAQLRDTHLQLQSGEHGAEVSMAMTETRDRLSEELRAGIIPKGAVSRGESEHVVDLAAAAQGIKSIRNAEELQRDVKGEVIAVSSQHSLVKIGDGIAVRFHQDSLDRSLEVGEKVAIKHEHATSKVYELGSEPQRYGEHERAHGREFESR